MRQTDFGRVAPAYHFLESLVFGQALHKRRCAFLNDLTGVSNVLILGDGDGRFTADFLRATGKIKVDYVDCSAGMIHLARRQSQALGSEAESIRFVKADVRTALFEGPYDLVITHFFLDCFTTEDLVVLIPRIAAAMTFNANWLLSEFQLPRHGVWRIAASLLIRMMYLFFRWTAGLQVKQLPDFRSVLKGCGFHREKGESALAELLVSELWSRVPESS